PDATATLARVQRPRAPTLIRRAQASGSLTGRSEPVEDGGRIAGVIRTRRIKETRMRRPFLLAAGLAAAALATVAALVAAPGPSSPRASSHREAPLIAEDPSADLTDLYAFRSPDKPDTVTIVANVLPGEDPAAGPNYYTFSPTARYNLKIDTNGDV